jgi:hypothetical protein
MGPNVMSGASFWLALKRSLLVGKGLISRLVRKTCANMPHLAVLHGYKAVSDTMMMIYRQKFAHFLITN